MLAAVKLRTVLMLGSFVFKFIDGGEEVTPRNLTAKTTLITENGVEPKFDDNTTSVFEEIFESVIVYDDKTDNVKIRVNNE